MQVGVVAVARPDQGHAPVGAVVEDVLALAEADLEDPALPPREHRFSLVSLDSEVRRLLPGRERVKPDEVAALIDDHRPGRALPLVGGEEQIAGRRAGFGGRGDPQRRGRQPRLRAVVLNSMRIAGFDRELRLAHRGLVGDREGRAHLLHESSRASAGMNGHLLAFEEGVPRQEALPCPGRVFPQHSGVHATARPDDVHVCDLRPTPSEEADLARRGGVAGTGQRRDGHRAGRGGSDCRCGLEDGRGGR